jgi:hypothetical protein
VIEVVDFFDAAGNLRGDIRDLDGNIIRPERVLVWTTRPRPRRAPFALPECRAVRRDRQVSGHGPGRLRPAVHRRRGRQPARGGGGRDRATDFTGGALVNLVYKPFNTSSRTRTWRPGIRSRRSRPNGSRRRPEAAATTEPADNGLMPPRSMTWC